jgi:protein O-GlcNAc transferase
MNGGGDPALALREAAAALSQGNIVYADMLAEDVLQQHPGHPAALTLIGVIAAHLGMRERALRCLREALQSAPSFPAAQNNLARVEAMPAPQLQPGERFLLVKAWGFGFWSEAAHVLGAALLAEITGRTALTQWGQMSLFGDGSGADGDAFRFYFEPLSPLTLAALPQVPADQIFPPKWTRETLAYDDLRKLWPDTPKFGAITLLNRPETIAVADFYLGVPDLQPWIPEQHRLHGKPSTDIYRDLIPRYLRPLPEITRAADAFHAQHLADKHVIAVHARGSDKAKEFIDLPGLYRDYFRVLDGEAPASTIFLMTEDARVLELFRRRYGTRLVTTDVQRTGNDTGPHYIDSMDRVRLGREVMTDAYIALRCQRFIGNGRSNVSAMIALMKDWAEDCVLLAPSQLLERNSYFFAPRR